MKLGGTLSKNQRQVTEQSPLGELRTMINLMSAATATPRHMFSTSELIASLMHKLSPELINTIGSLGVDQRYSVMDNYPDFLDGAALKPTTTTTGLGVNGTKRCVEEWGGDTSRIGLLVAATNTPDQMLPCLASGVMGQTHGLLSRSLRTVSMQSQGCSVLLKSVEVAQWYLAANPDKLAKEGKINEAAFAQLRLDTTFVIQSMLFGDGAVALLIGREEGKPSFGPISHLTNDDLEDVNLLTMTSSSSHPFLKGRPQYFMRPNVPSRGAHYAVTTVNNVLEHPDSPVSNLAQVADCLIHTGSKKILDGVCSQLHLEKDSTKVHGSYEVLKNYGNLSSASTGFMLAEKDEWSGPAMVVGFGVGFTASAGVMSLN